MTDSAYETIAAVYEFLVPDELLTPRGAAAAFAAHVGDGDRVLDCACGTGALAVGLALRGHAVAATDASPAMIARTRALAAAHGARVDASVCAWRELGERAWREPFDTVLCVGNSLAHAAGRDERRAALRAMAATLRPGGALVVTSRDWEQVRAAGSRLQVAGALVRRGDRRGLPISAWEIPVGWEQRHCYDVAVALVGDDGRVTTHRERLAFWPFTAPQLREDLAAAGLEPGAAAAFADAPGRYLLSARRAR